MRLLAAATVLIACLFVGAVPAWAQAGWYVIPSFTLTEQYDDNIFGTSADRQADFISRFSPGLQGGYRSEPFTIMLLGELTAEVFARNPDLNNATSGKRAALALQYLPTRVWTLNFDVSYTETESVTNLIPLLASPVATPGPGGFTLTPTSPTPLPTTPTAPTTTPPPGTQTPPAGTSPAAATPNINTLEFGRQRATLLYISPAVQYQFGPGTSATAGYSYTRGTLEDTDTVDHRLFASASHQFTPIDTGQIRYSFDIFGGTNSDNVTSNVVTLGWTRRLTPSTTVSLNIGPRFTEGTVSPDVDARLEHQFRVADVFGSAFLSYSRSETIVLGQEGPSRVETYAAGISAQPLRNLQVALSPAVTKFSQTGNVTTTTPETTTYGVYLGASYQILRWLVGRASYGFQYQKQDTGDIPRNVISLSLEVAYPYRVDR